MKRIYPIDSNGRPHETREKRRTFADALDDTIQYLRTDLKLAKDEIVLLKTQKKEIIDSYEYKVQWLQDRVNEGVAREDALKKTQTKLVTEIERLKTKLDEYE